MSGVFRATGTEAIHPAYLAASFWSLHLVLYFVDSTKRYLFSYPGRGVLIVEWVTCSHERTAVS